MGANYIYDLSLSELGEYFTGLGEPKYRAGQVFAALHNGVLVKDIPNIPKHLRERIASDFNCDLPTIENVQTSKDGTQKFLLKMRRMTNEVNESNLGKIDSNNNSSLVIPHSSLIECVLLKQDYGNTVCISSQVGCKMGCAFCASGANGFVRNLSAGEMLGQVLLMRRITNEVNEANSCKIESNNNSSFIIPHSSLHVVLMGSGEPFDNFDEVVKFLRLVTGQDDARTIRTPLCENLVPLAGARRISVSTAGIVPRIREFADLQMQVNLCISLHAPNDEIRKTIMPIAKKYSINDLVSAARYFFEKTHRRVIFEYALINGVNCAPEHAKELAKLLKGAGFAYHVNLITLNPTDGGFLQPPPRDVAMKYMDTLIKSGVSCTMRKSRGSDIDGACGQLALRQRKENL